MKRKKVVTLPPVNPNAGLTAQYRKRLLALLDDMQASVLRWLSACYRANEPAVAELASDAAKTKSAADQLQDAVRALRRRWMKNFDAAALRLAKYFATAAAQRTDAQLKKILKDGGFSVEFKMTKAQRDIAKAVVHENVNLIKSIPEQYLNQVEGITMRAVQTGMDVGGLQKDLIRQFGVTKRRANLIARDQNSKATSAFNRARQMELGIEEAVWHHSSAGKHPRPSHVKAGREAVRYKVSEGWYDPDEGKRIWPGQLINCRCTARSIIPGFV